MTACRSNRLNESLVGKARPRRPACSLNHPVYRLYICGLFHLKPHLVHDEKTDIRWHSIIRSEAHHSSHFFPMSLFMGLHFDVISLQGLYSTFSLYSVLHVFIIPFSPMSTFCLFIFLFKFIQGLVVYLFYFIKSFLRKVIETFLGFKSNLTASPPVTLFTILNFCPGDSRLALTLSSYSLQSKTLSNPMPPCLVFVPLSPKQDCMPGPNFSL